jgi:hypothetical protein
LNAKRRPAVFLVLFDPTKQRPAETIGIGMERYRERHGRDPALCLVAEGTPDVPDAPMPTTPYRGISRYHYFLGEFEEGESRG